jgi:hypothetical protein
MSKKKEEKEMDRNGQEPKYKTDRGEEIEYFSDSLYDEITLQFSRIRGFLDVMEVFGHGYRYGPKKDLGGDIFNLAEIGRTLLKDIKQRFDQIYEIVEAQVGDVYIDFADYGQPGIEDDRLLGAYLKPLSE